MYQVAYLCREKYLQQLAQPGAPLLGLEVERDLVGETRLLEREHAAGSRQELTHTLLLITRALTGFDPQLDAAFPAH